MSDVPPKRQKLYPVDFESQEYSFTIHNDVAVTSSACAVCVW